MKITCIIRKVLNNIRFYKSSFAEWGKDSFKYFWAVKRGFKRTAVDILGITKENEYNFLSSTEYREKHPYNNAYSSIIDNKLYLPMLLSDYKEYLPEYYFFIDEYGLLELTGEQRRVDYESFFDKLNEKKILCLKHCYSSLGQGFLLVKEESTGFSINGESKTKNDILNTIKNLSNYIVTEYIYQHSYSSNICSTSLNSIRFVFIYDGESRTFRHVRSFHRFGCNGAVVDNLAAGNGICTFIDIEKGTLTNKSEFNYKGSGNRIVYDVVHPDNNILLTGVVIPRFFEVRDKVIEILNKKSFLKFCGFDIAITEDSFKIVEINSLPDLIISQPECGFLKEPWMRKIFKR